MSVRFIIGVDGGGTGTRARVTAPDGTVLGFGEAGASGLGQGIEAAWGHVLEAIAHAFEAAPLPVASPQECALGLGMAGAHVRERCSIFLEAAPPFSKLALDNDAYTALLGAHEGYPGALVAAGTGSVGEVLRRDGTRAAVGGWGFPVGDEGSGAWLGLHAMRLAHRAVDGWFPAGPVVRAVWSFAGDTREALLAWCEHAGQHAYAQLAPMVFDAAPDDPAADDLLSAAASSLQAIAMALDPAGELPLAITGSIAVRLAPRFSAQIRARCVAPVGDSADGALRLITTALGGAPHGAAQ